MELQGIKFSTKVVKEQAKRTLVPYEFEGLNWMTEGGNCLGDLVVLVGNTGLGKSTLATQLCGYWWKQKGYKTLIYSGEMDAAAVIKDLSLQQDFEGEDDNCFIASIIDIEGIEHCAAKENYKVFLIDNLMTLSQFDDDLYMSQSRTVKRLKEIALKYNCLILLVCHPNKTKEFKKGENLTIDSISGSSNIGNLANLIMALNRGEELNQRVLEVLKNRKTGQLGTLRLKFFKETKRYEEV